MSDSGTMTKQDKIRKLLEMQKAFIDVEHQGKFSMREYFSDDEKLKLSRHRKNYMKLAMEVVADAHKEVGSRQ